ncbi:MAG: oligosaccharide flippase family protein [Candidatus Lokiarchaeota archaeon]|nr:oligosaccharide flippase family protein [Candidatus Lokiarchaeota archaeon]
MDEEEKAQKIEEKISYKISFSERVGRNTLFILASNIINFGLKTVLIPIILGFIQYDWGYYYIIRSYAMLIVFITSFITLGINFSSPKWISEYLSLNNNKKLNDVFSLLFFLNILTAIVRIILLYVVLILYLPSNLVIEASFFNIYFFSAISMILLIPALSFQSIFLNILAGFQRNDFIVFINIIINIVISISKLVLIFLKFNIIGLIISDYLYLYFGSFVMYYIIKKRYPSLKFNFKSINFKNIKEFCTSGFTMRLANFDSTLYNDINTILIQNFASFSPVYTDPKILITNYATSMKIGRYSTALTSSIESGNLSIATELFVKNEKQKLKELFGRIINLSFFFALSIATGISLLSNNILLHYLGPAFQDSWFILVCFLFMFAINLNTQFCKELLQTMNLTKKLLYITIGEYSALIIFSLIGFIFFGVSGMAFGVLMAIAIYSTIVILYTAKKINFSGKKLGKIFLKIITSIIVPVIIFLILLYYNIIPYFGNEGFIYLIFDGLILLAFFGISTLIFYILKGLNKKDIDALKRSIKNIYKSIKRRVFSILRIKR